MHMKYACTFHKSSTDFSVTESSREEKNLINSSRDSQISNKDYKTKAVRFLQMKIGFLVFLTSS